MSIPTIRRRERIFDTLLFLLAVFGAWGATASFRSGGAWNALGVAFLLGLMLLASGVFIEPRFLRIVRYREPLVKHPGTWVRFVFLSDFHAGGFRNREWYERLSVEAQALDPDVLVLGGDFVVDAADAVRDIEPLTRVTAHHGRYFFLGNHDFLDDPRRIRRTLREWGIADLTNAHVSIRKDGHELQITGLDDHYYGRPIVPPFRPSVTLPHVTIAHEPDGIRDLEAGQTDLYLAGHTHGGQIRLPFLGSLAPIPSTLGRLADRGRKNVRGIPLIVTQGCGEADLRARLFCPAEIMVVEVGI
ncbi:metallophosphoesterase [Candidatus Uhrbacteria bacterium]|nr:metallophosphoesterase [Candidatus Uhrbacteria bacterium]